MPAAAACANVERKAEPDDRSAKQESGAAIQPRVFPERVFVVASYLCRFEPRNGCGNKLRQRRCSFRKSQLEGSLQAAEPRSG
jgi:hypothetical protein